MSIKELQELQNDIYDSFKNLEPAEGFKLMSHNHSLFTGYQDFQNEFIYNAYKGLEYKLFTQRLYTYIHQCIQEAIKQEQARLEKEAEEQARHEAEQKERLEKQQAEEQARQEAEQKARFEKEAEEQARRDAEQKERLEKQQAEEQARREAEQKAQLEKQQTKKQARHEAEQKAQLEKQQTEEQARREAEQKTRLEKQQTEEQARREAEQKAQLEKQQAEEPETEQQREHKAYLEKLRGNKDNLNTHNNKLEREKRIIKQKMENLDTPSFSKRIFIFLAFVVLISVIWFGYFWNDTITPVKPHNDTTSKEQPKTDFSQGKDATEEKQQKREERERQARAEEEANKQTNNTTTPKTDDKKENKDTTKTTKDAPVETPKPKEPCSKRWTVPEGYTLDRALIANEADKDLATYRKMTIEYSGNQDKFIIKNFSDGSVEYQLRAYETITLFFPCPN